MATNSEYKRYIYTAALGPLVFTTATSEIFHQLRTMLLFCFYIRSSVPKCFDMAYKQAPQELIFESLGAIICLSVITPRQCAGSSLLWEPANAGHGVYNADPPRGVTSQCKVTQNSQT